MTAQSKIVLKSYFQRGLRPTQSNYADLIDSFPLAVSADTPFTDADPLVKGSADPTKLFRIEVDGFTPGVTRVMTPPDADFNAVGTTNTQTLTNKTLTTPTLTTPIFSGNPTGTIINGFYTPTLTNGGNVAASTPFQCMYTRIGAMVIVGGAINLDPTTTLTTTTLGISLPIASTLGTTLNVAGTAAIGSADAAGRINGNDLGDRAELVCTPTSVAAQDWWFTFVYYIV